MRVPAHAEQSRSVHARLNPDASQSFPTVDKNRATLQARSREQRYKYHHGQGYMPSLRLHSISSDQHEQVSQSLVCSPLSPFVLCHWTVTACTFTAYFVAQWQSNDRLS